MTTSLLDKLVKTDIIKTLEAAKAAPAAPAPPAAPKPSIPLSIPSSSILNTASNTQKTISAIAAIPAQPSTGAPAITGGVAPMDFVNSGSSATPEQIAAANVLIDQAAAEALDVTAKGAIATAAITVGAAPILGVVSPAGTAAAVVSKTIIKGGIPLILAGGVVGYLLGGGNKQEQKQDAKQQTVVTPEQDTKQNAFSQILARLRGDTETNADTTQKATSGTYGDTTFEGSAFNLSDIRDFLYSPTYETITESSAAPTTDILSGLFNLAASYQGQAAAPTQITITTPEIAQAQTATQTGTNWLLIAALAAGAYLLFKGDKK